MLSQKVEDVFRILQRRLVERNELAQDGFLKRVMRVVLLL